MALWVASRKISTLRGLRKISRLDISMRMRFTISNCQITRIVAIFWWVSVIWPSKDVRDVAWQKTMEDPRMQEDQNPMPFDGERLIYGGFNIILEE